MIPLGGGGGRGGVCNHPFFETLLSWIRIISKDSFAFLSIFYLAVNWDNRQEPILGAFISVCAEAASNASSSLTLLDNRSSSIRKTCYLAFIFVTVCFILSSLALKSFNGYHIFTNETVPSNSWMFLAWLRALLSPEFLHIDYSEFLFLIVWSFILLKIPRIIKISTRVWIGG